MLKDTESHPNLFTSIAVSKIAHMGDTIFLILYVRFPTQAFAPVEVLSRSQIALGVVQREALLIAVY